MRNTHFTSDCHFGHAMVLVYASRPFLTADDTRRQSEITNHNLTVSKELEIKFRPSKESVDNADNILIANWNSRVKPGDTVYHLGDFAFGREDYIRSILRRLNGNKVMIFGNHDKELIKNRDLIIADASCNVTEMLHYKEVNFSGEMFVLFHYGQRVWNRSHYGSFLLYGHSHGSLPPLGKSLDVGVDVDLAGPKYYPRSVEEIKAFMKTRTISKEDRH